MSRLRHKRISTKQNKNELRFFTMIIDWGKDVFFSFYFLWNLLIPLSLGQSESDYIHEAKRKNYEQNRICSDGIRVWFEHTKRSQASHFSLSFHDFLYQPFWKPILTNFYSYDLMRNGQLFNLVNEKGQIGTRRISNTSKSKTTFYPRACLWFQF